MNSKKTNQWPWQYSWRKSQWIVKKYSVSLNTVLEALAPAALLVGIVILAAAMSTAA